MQFYFKHSPRDFVVDEIPLYDFSGEGEHLVIKVRKKSLSTWEMLSRIANELDIKIRDIGYAGMKDKHAMTTQYISVLKIYEEKIDAMSIDGIKVLEKQYHNNKIRTGHLKGNRFFIRLKKVTPADAKKIEQAIKHLAKDGMPNYFGFQRFGNDLDNHITGKAIIDGTHKERNKKLRTLMINAYQSDLFNQWLDKRLVFMQDRRQEGNTEGIYTDSPLGFVKGDIAMHYPQARAFKVEDPEADAHRIDEHAIVVSGLLAGKKSIRAEGIAYELEKEFDVQTTVDGARRLAWIYPEAIETNYRSVDGWMELHFTLQKGSYATVLIEQIAKTSIHKLMEGLS
jgi:tRNA pseudouridine13 synthase